MLLLRQPDPVLREQVARYWGYEERTPRRTRREGPGSAVVLSISVADGWLIDGSVRDSFVGGLRTTQVTTENAGRTAGVQVDLVPSAAHRLLRVPMCELAETTVPLDDLLPVELVERVGSAPDFGSRFAVMNEFLACRLLDGAYSSPEVVWAWQRLRDTHGRTRIGSLTEELGWSRKRLVARFREEVGLPPKAVARLLRFERARRLAGRMGWAELADICGYADQSHLIAEFRAFSGRTPETFVQDDAVLAS